jgi:hypothetical protein
MAKFVIEPHFRLQEWVAEEKGYFRAEGLDYDSGADPLDRRQAPRPRRQGRRVPVVRARRAADVSCACHWTVNVAAATGQGKALCRRLLGRARRRVRAGRLGHPTPEDLAGVPISVGFQSGSHYATIQALEQYLPADKINLHFADGMLFRAWSR